MTLLKRKTSLPSIFSNFFESDPFFNSDWISNNWMSEVPNVNVVENDKEYELELAVPGMKKEDFHVTCENGYLTIKAEKEEEKKEQKKNYTRREYNYNSFCRTFNLPETVKSDNVKAKYDNGLLKITVPKNEKAKVAPKREIKIG